MSLAALGALTTSVLALALTVVVEAVMDEATEAETLVGTMASYTAYIGLFVVALTVVPAFALTGLLHASGDVLLALQSGVIAACYFVTA